MNPMKLRVRSARAARQMSDPATDNPAPAPSVATGDDTVAQIDAVLGEIQATAEQMTQNATQALAATDESALQQIADAVPAGSAAPPPTGGPVTDNGNETENLDAQLERLTAGLLEEEAKAAPASAPASVPAPAPEPAPVVPPAAVTSRETLAAASTAAASEPTIATPRPTTVVASSPPAPAPQPKPRRELLKPVVDGLKRTWPVFNVLVLKSLAPLSRPLLSGGKAVRIGVSLLAVQSMVLAAGAWAYLAFARPTSPVSTAEHGFDFGKDGLPQPPTPGDHEAQTANAPAAEGHGEAKEGEHATAKPTKKKAPSKSTKKPPAKKPAAEEHGGGEH
ncbi:MAG: hypothetical protein JSR77_06910 [Planctomycetes bacterium]|nr:hypothetical protein [Planctomycetota bacterium]